MTTRGPSKVINPYPVGTREHDVFNEALSAAELRVDLRVAQLEKKLEQTRELLIRANQAMTLLLEAP